MRLDLFALMVCRSADALSVLAPRIPLRFLMPPHQAAHAGHSERPSSPAQTETGNTHRDEPAAQSRPGWRIETSLRRASVCLRQEGAAGAGGASEPSSTSIPIEGVTLLPFRSHLDHVSTGPDGRSTRAISRRAASAPQLLASVSEGFRAVGGDRHQLWYFTI